MSTSTSGVTKGGRADLVLYVCTIAAVLHLLAVDAIAQSVSDRAALASSLNAAMPDSGESAMVALPASWKFPGMPSGCISFATTDSVQLTRAADGKTITIRIQIAPADSAGAIPISSHAIVCDLEGWLFRSLTEEKKDSGQGHYDAMCGAGVQGQEYWLAETGLDDVIELQKFSPFPFDDYPVPTEVSSEIVVQAVDSILKQDSIVRWIIKRFPAVTGPDTLRAQRARASLIVDTAAHPGLISKPGGATLTRIDFEATIPLPTSNFCTGTSSYGPAIATYTVSYTNSDGTSHTASRTHNQTVFGTQQTDSMWAFLDWRHRGDLMMSFDIDSEGFPYLLFMPEGQTVYQRFYLPQYRSRIVPAEQCEMILPLTGSVNGFDVDPVTGQIVFVQGAATLATMNSSEGDRAVNVTCLAGCDEVEQSRWASNVIAATATTLKAAWLPDTTPAGHTLNYDPTRDRPYDRVPPNRFERGADGKWRPYRSYVYRSAIMEGTANPIYADAGVFVDAMNSPTNAFTEFEWKSAQPQVPQWLMTNTVTQYAPSGEPIEERDALGVPSSAALGFRELMPIVVAKNAERGAVAFESFEELDTNYVTTTTRHSGRRSVLVPANGSIEALRYVVTPQALSKGIIVKLWLKRTYDAPLSGSPVKLRVGTQWISAPAGAADGTEPPGKIVQVAQTGEWSLYSLTVLGSSIGVPSGSTDVIELARSDTSIAIWVDDVRVQPVESQMMCYTYDPRNLRLDAQFDDQHFGRFYRYNGEGKLLRTVIETERGVKTVAESYNHTPLVLRAQPPGPPGGAEAMIAQSSGYLTTSEDLRIRRFAAEASSASGRRQFSDQYELLGLTLGPGGPGVSFLGGESVDLARLDSFFTAAWRRVEEFDADSLGALMPEVEAEKRQPALQQLLEYDRQLREAEVLLSDPNTDAEGRVAAGETLIAVRREREHLLRRDLGLDYDHVRRLYEELELAPEQGDAKGR